MSSRRGAVVVRLLLHLLLGVVVLAAVACAPFGFDPAAGAADPDQPDTSVGDGSDVGTVDEDDEGGEVAADEVHGEDGADATTQSDDPDTHTADQDPSEASGEPPAAATEEGAGMPAAGLPALSDGSEPGEPRRFTIAAVGDVLPHVAVVERGAAYGRASGQPYDFRPMFAEVAPIVQAADLGFCNMETPLATDQALVDRYLGQRTPAGGAPIFIAPRHLGEAMADAGFTVCSTANNHATDTGVEGLVATLEVLDDVGIAATGTGRTREEVREPAWLEVNGVTVAVLAASYGVNIPLPAGQEWMVQTIDVDRLLDQARAVRDAGAEVVILSLHHGLEYQIDLSDGQRERTGPLLEDGSIDLILGHHAHVVQAIQRVHGRVAVHGLGNILSNQYAGLTGPETQDGVIALLEVSEHPGGDGFLVTDVSYVPTWVDRDRHVIVDVGTALASDGLDATRRAELEGSWARTVAAVNGEGADTWGVEPSAGTAWFDERPTRQLPVG